MTQVALNVTGGGETWGDGWSGERAPAMASGALVTRPKAIAWVRMAPDILRAMALAANHAGRGVGEVWAEAAREWLLRKSLDAEFDLLSNQPERKAESAALLETKRRLWTTIDTAMEALRQSRPTI